MLLSVEVSSSCCAAAWLSHAGSPCPSSSLICALLPLDQATDLFFFLTFLPAKGWSVCPLQIKQFFSLLFHISSIAALLKPIVVVSSPCPVGMFQWCPWTSWPSYPWGWPLVPDKNKAFPPSTTPWVSISCSSPQRLHGDPWSWRRFWGGSQNRGQRWVCMWAHATKQVLWCCLCDGDRARTCLSRSLVKVHPDGYEGLADVVLPLQQPSCNGSRCPCEELALPIWPLHVLELIYHH